VDIYCAQTYQTFVKDDSKTGESVNKHRKMPFLSELKFAFADVVRPLWEKVILKGRCLQANDQFRGK